jgi:hypothetical protein
MQIVSIRHLEDCFDGTIMKEVTFDRSIDEQFIRYWEIHGTLQYFPSFARPFFTVDVPRRFVLKGIQGNLTARLILCREGIEENERRFRSLVDYGAIPDG